MRRADILLILAIVCGLLFCLLATAVQTNHMTGFDDAIRTGLHSYASPPLTLAAQRLTWLGSVVVITACAAILVAAMAFMRQRRSAVFVAAMVVGSLILENGLKFWFRRVRPSAFFGAETATYSFPSGHSLFSLCFYIGLAFVISGWTRSSVLKAGIWTLAIIMVLSIGLTRIYLGVHYPSDVLGGYLVGLAWLGVALAASAHIQS